jgi:hypothetical protein
MENLTQTEREAIQHWTAYGQRGKTPSHRVMPWEWCNKPFVKRISSPWHIKIEPDQLPLLLLGFLPRMAEHGLVDPRIFVVGEPVESHIFMSTSTRKDVSASEDKWFIYADGPNGNGEARVHFHRSWTGIVSILLFRLKSLEHLVSTLSELNMILDSMPYPLQSSVLEKPGFAASYLSTLNFDLHYSNNCVEAD